MNHNPFRRFLPAASATALLLACALRAEDAATPPPPADASTAPAAVQPAKPDNTPPAPATVETPPTPAAATAAAPAAPAAEAPAAAPAVTPAEPAKEAPPAAPAPTELRRLDSETAPATAGQKKEEGAPGRKHVHLRGTYTGEGNERVSILHDTFVEKDESVQAAVAIVGDTTVDGNVSDAAVAVVGNTTVNGTVRNAAVAVMGDLRVDGSVGDAAVAVGGSAVVNGHVHGDLVSVGGKIKLGPDAVVDGQLVVVGGNLEKAPTSVIKGNIQRVRLPAIGGVFSWARSALFKGRLLSFAGGAGWAWVVAAAFLGFYVLLGLLFPRGVEKCAETLEQKPGFTILTAFLIMLAMPLVFVVLAITGVGLLVIPVLGLGLFVGKLFGRAAMLAWYGRRFTGWFGGGRAFPAAMTILIGGLFVMVLYLVPLLAFAVLWLNGFLGLGMVIYTLILGMRRNGGKRAPAAVPAAAMAAAVPGVAGGAPGEAAPPLVGAVPIQPVVSAATLPRAGFWIRLVASFLDAILIAVAAAFIHLPGFFLLGFATYCVVLWATRGSTVGGVICGLKVVRLDDRPVDWSMAIVRALAAFLSLAVAGLGFIWVVFDDERQSWHDKIAGTTIVHVPKGMSLV